MDKQAINCKHQQSQQVQDWEDMNNKRRYLQCKLCSASLDGGAHSARSPLDRDVSLLQRVDGKALIILSERAQDGESPHDMSQEITLSYGELAELAAQINKLLK